MARNYGHSVTELLRFDEMYYTGELGGFIPLGGEIARHCYMTVTFVNYPKRFGGLR